MVHREGEFSDVFGFPSEHAGTLPAAMRLIVDLIYGLFVLISAPIWLLRMVQANKHRTDWPARFGGGETLRRSDQPTILLHGVSVGEINAIRLLVERLDAQTPKPRIVIATTTDTGFKRANELFGGRFHVTRYPLDFSFAVCRFLDRIKPDAVALVELEVWPNFTAECSRRGIPVCVVNGRLSERSFRWYRRLRVFVRPSFQRLRFAAVQSDAYRQRFVAMGMPAEQVHVSGTMKWDTAAIADDVPGADELAMAMGIDRAQPLIVAGSTAPEEHQLLIDSIPDGVQLLCAPRRPEWFDNTAQTLAGCARRSAGTRGSSTGRFLLDTIGELRAAYALADVVVVGRSFGSLHGSDMIEPVALGKATIVGPAVEDFKDIMRALLDGGGIVQTDRAHLVDVLGELLNDPKRRSELAERGRCVIRAHQGATDRQAQRVAQMLH